MSAERAGLPRLAACQRCFQRKVKVGDSDARSGARYGMLTLAVRQREAEMPALREQQQRVPRGEPRCP
jgi:hypothetical protein